MIQTFVCLYLSPSPHFSSSTTTTYTLNLESHKTQLAHLFVHLFLSQSFQSLSPLNLKMDDCNNPFSPNFMDGFERDMKTFQNNKNAFSNNLQADMNNLQTNLHANLDSIHKTLNHMQNNGAGYPPGMSTIHTNGQTYYIPQEAGSTIIHDGVLINGVQPPPPWRLQFWRLHLYF